MTEINALRVASKTVLRDIAKHSSTLAAGLQNAAPPKEGGPGNSILYLSEVSTLLQDQVHLLEPSTEE